MRLKPASVLFITRKWPPAVGGMETYSVKLAEGLAQSVDVELIALPGRIDGSPPSTFELILFGIRTSLRLLAGPQLPQVIHIGDAACWALGLVARLRSRQAIIAVSAHGTDVAFPLRGGLLARLYGMYLRVGARLLPNIIVIANSSATREATSKYGFRHIVVVPLATDASPGCTIKPPSDHVFFSGRLVPRKGCAWFIRNVLDKLPPEMTLRVAGTIWNESERAALDHRRVRYLGALGQAQLQGEYREALCVVSPNIDVESNEFEGFGMCATEAAASGGVSLASFHSGLKEAVIDGVTGFHVPPNDARAWVAKILDVRSWDQLTRERFIERSTVVCRDSYSWARTVELTLAAYCYPANTPS